MRDALGDLRPGAGVSLTIALFLSFVWRYRHTRYRGFAIASLDHVQRGESSSQRASASFEELPRPPQRG